MRILGVDPGARHVGVSLWEDLDCLDATEVTPREFAEAVVRGSLLEGIGTVCAEDFLSQGGFGSARTGADTSELLGLLIWTARLEYDLDPVRVTRMARDSALKRLRAVSYPFVGTGVSDHARDAECVVVAGMKYSVRGVRARDGHRGTIEAQINTPRRK